MENENTGLVTPGFVYSEEKQKEYVRSFKLANNDPEMMELAEECLDDFVEMIDGVNCEQSITVCNKIM